MCDVLQYMCCFYWLMNKAVWINGLAEYSHTGKQIRDREKAQAESGKHHVAAKGGRCHVAAVVKRHPEP